MCTEIRQRGNLELVGTLDWDGDLDQMRDMRSLGQ